MTRTERNQAPAALLKDRHSRSGLPLKAELARKNGAGAHNWGSFKEEGELEQQAFNDADAEVFEMDGAGAAPIPAQQHAAAAGAANGEADTIATSPSESMSSTSEGEAKPAQLNRRMSNVSDEERERARVYREGVVRRASHNGNVDLAHIAQTSYGIAQSPPAANGLATSPTKTKGGNMGYFGKQ